MHRRYAERILRGHGGQHAGAEHAAHLKRLQIRLYPRSAAGIRACDGQRLDECFFHLVSPIAWLDDLGSGLKVV